MFLEDSAMPAHSESGLPRDEEEPLSAATSLTQEGFVGTPDYDAPPKRGRKKLPLTKKGQQKLEKQQKKLEIDKERENSLCAKYQVVIENNPWEFKRNSVPFVARWNKIVGILKERKLLENIPNASKLFQNHVSKALEKFYKVFVKRPTGTEPPAMDDKDQLLLEIYQLKKSGPVGEGINPGAEDRRRGLEKRTMARRTLGMSTANKVSDLLADDEDILDYNSDERICLREEAEATGLVGRLNRKESFELDIDGPLWRNNAVVSSSKSNGKVMFVHKRKGNLPERSGNPRGGCCFG
ncbi:uncharacterized protein LOC129601994 isoform X2 [Paramacrobiotus metropolitanus]|nr:uncharacterized protein LOC129601994 isoform X2 [Paramacrobiotus metropolitanus]